jgi:hypothetical protein
MIIVVIIAGLLIYGLSVNSINSKVKASDNNPCNSVKSDEWYRNNKK